MIVLIIQCFSTFTSIFAYCEIGQRVGIAFDKINIALDQLKWYLLPHKIRKMLLNILVVTQEPVEFAVFGSISCNRRTFEGVSSINLLQS